MEDLVAYLDDELSPEKRTAVEEALAHDSNVVEALADLCEQRLLLAEVMNRKQEGVLSSDQPNQVHVVAAKPTRFSFRRFAMPLGIAAAALITASGGLWFARWSRSSDPVVLATLTEVHGVVSCIRGTTEISVQRGMRIFEKDQVRSAADGRATFQFSGETSSVCVKKETSVILAKEQGAKRLILKQGSLECDVAPQPHGLPMVLETPIAKVTVVGTRFSLYGDEIATRLDVEKGKVQLLRKSDGTSVMVSDGQYVEATKDSVLNVITKGCGNGMQKDMDPVRDPRRGKLVFEETFEKVEEGKLPKGWQKRYSKKTTTWKVVSNDVQRALQGSGKDAGIEFGSSSWKNTETHFKFRLNETGPEEIMFFCRLSAKNGEAAGLVILPLIEESKKASLPGWDNWHCVEIVCRDEKTRIWVNGCLWETTTDKLWQGRSGFMFSNGTALIDDVRVWELEE